MATKKPRPAKPETHVVVTPQALVVSLSEADQRAAKQCLEKSGEVRFSMREVSVTNLPEARPGAHTITID
jgi:hypothetical protein